MKEDQADNVFTRLEVIAGMEGWPVTPGRHRVEFNEASIIVRIASPTRRVGTDVKRYQFNVTSMYGNTSPWFLVAACVTQQGTHLFYIPGAKVSGPTLQITGEPWEYTGYAAGYLNNHNRLSEWLIEQGGSDD